MSDKDKKKEKKTDEELAAEVRRLLNTRVIKEIRIKKNRAKKQWQRDNV
tara:strand:- start:204 stop:350 length:147 start_codon:yes stop_codon:yes gene_type:complete